MKKYRLKSHIQETFHVEGKEERTGGWEARRRGEMLRSAGGLVWALQKDQKAETNQAYLLRKGEEEHPGKKGERGEKEGRRGPRFGAGKITRP